MRATAEWSLSTVLIAVLVVAYVAHLWLGGLPLVGDASGMATVGLVLGFVSRRIGGWPGFHHEGAFFADLAVLTLGVVAHATGSGMVLAAFVAGNVAVWAAEAHGGARRSDGAGAGGRSRAPCAHAGAHRRASGSARRRCARHLNRGGVGR